MRGAAREPAPLLARRPGGDLKGVDRAGKLLGERSIDRALALDAGPAGEGLRN